MGKFFRTRRTRRVFDAYGEVGPAFAREPPVFHPPVAQDSGFQGTQGRTRSHSETPSQRLAAIVTDEALRGLLGAGHQEDSCSGGAGNPPMPSESVCQRRPRGNAYRWTWPGRISVPLGRKLRVEVFTHVDSPGEGIAGKGAAEDEADRIAGLAELAPQLDLIPLDCAEDVTRGKISLMRALNPVAILRQVQRVLALAAEEFDVAVPAAGGLGSWRGGRGRCRAALFGKHCVNNGAE